MLLASLAHGRVPERLGNRSTGVAPQGCYPCAGTDEWCAISVQNDAQWAAFIDALGSPAWATDERFRGVVANSRRHDELDSRIGDWTRGLSAGEVEERLKAGGVPAARMRRIDDVLSAPDRSGVFQPAQASPGAVLPFTRLPFGMAPGAVPNVVPAPRLGEHTADALQDWIGLEAEEVARLQQQEVLV